MTEFNLIGRRGTEQRIASGLPVAGELEASAGTGESTVVGSSYPDIPKTNSGAPMSGYARQARLAAASGETYSVPSQLIK